MFNNYDYLFKILLIGDSGVGKSSLLLKYVDDNFDRSYISTIGVDFKIKTLMYKNKIIKLQIWDTAGQERFRTVTTSYYRGANGIIVGFDLTNEESFYNVSNWLNEIKTNCCINENKIFIIVVGTKSDLVSKRVVNKETIQKFISDTKCTYIETSSLTGQNVEKVFNEMVIDLVNFREDSKNEKRTTVSIKLKPISGKKEDKKYCWYF